MISSVTEFCLIRHCMKIICNGEWFVIHSRNRSSCSSKYIYMPIHKSLLVSKNGHMVWLTIIVHPSLQLSLEVESFYLPIMKLYGFIRNGALWGSLFYKEIFFRLILITFFAPACSINGDMISLRDVKTTPASLPLHTARSEFRVPKPQSRLWSPGKQV